MNLKAVLQATSNVDKQFEAHLDKSIAFVLQRCSDTVDKTRAVSIWFSGIVLSPCSEITQRKPEYGI